MTVEHVAVPLSDHGVIDAVGWQRTLLQARIVRAVTREASTPLDLRARPIVAACFDEFFRARLRPQAALRATAPLMHELGTAQARLGCTRDEVDAAFAQVHDIVVGALSQLSGGRVVGEPMLRLRGDVKQYLDGLYRQLSAAVERELVRQSRTAAQRSALGGLSIADTVPRPEGRVRVLVSVESELPCALFEDSGVLRGRSAFEAVLLQHVDPDELEYQLSDQVVVGPLTSWEQFDESSALSWRAAALLGEGRAVDTRRLVPCADLLHAILIGGSSVMTELLADKHLGPLDSLSPRRRRELSAVLLAWLERGVAGNALAREIGMPPQTVHHRLKQLRELFGRTLDDPQQRLELIVALRATHGEWSQAG